ncbi:MAG: DUF4347 domain-containing protein, partial [Planctomycetaceae bacterium]|nr:DUF4347 domain-containing protein [Planctomycetaceae bacterium]
MSLRNFIRRTHLLIQQGLYESRHTPHGHQGTLELTRLEERVLFSASAVTPVLAEVAEISGALFADSGPATDATAFNIPDQQILDLVADSVLPSQTADPNQVGTATEHTLELVFLDSSVSNLDQIISDLKTENAADSSRTLEYIMLDSTRDGIAQITSALLNFNGIDGMHIVSHGSDGQVQLGSMTLSLANLDRYRTAISAWQHSMSDKADILIYGCDVAASDNGQELLSQLSDLTQTDVASGEGFAAADVQTSGDVAMTSPAASVATQLIFVDTSVDRWETLLENARRESLDAEVVIIDGEADGISQITAALQGRHDISAIHLISHGDPGELLIGNSRLNISNLEDYADSIGGWKDALSADADILIYGCDIGQGIFGQGFVQQLATMTGADVAASTNATGTASLGGDWTLEYNVGQIETASLFNTPPSDWTGVLAVTSNGTVTSGLMNNGTSLTFSHTVAAGTNRVMFVEIAIDGLGANVTSVTYGGVALTQVGRGAGNHAVEIWKLVNPTVGTANVVINFAGTTTAAAGATTFNGVDQTTPNGTFVSATGTSTTATFNVASAVGDVVIDAQYWKGISTTTDGAGQTAQWGQGNATFLGGFTIEAGATTVTMSGTSGTSTQWEIAAVSVKAAAAAANTAPTLNASKSPVLTAENEDAAVPTGAVGTLISSLVDFATPSGQVDNVTDPDSGAALGIAVSAADTTQGSWYYTTNGGTNWLALGSVSSSNARLLAADSNTRLYFKPNANYNGTLSSAITFYAWDQTSGANGSLVSLTSSDT